MQNTIPTGPVITWPFDNESYLQSLNVTDISGDSFPHKIENIYLLAVLVVSQPSPDVANLKPITNKRTLYSLESPAPFILAALYYNAYIIKNKKIVILPIDYI
jgi:hypothetical protein